MSRWDAAPEILSLAEELGFGGAATVDGILDYCRERIDGWVAEAGGVTNINALESLVTQQLQMVFVEVRSDADFDRITDAYARGKKEFVFAAMRGKFDDAENPTFGALVKRKHVGDDAPGTARGGDRLPGREADPALLHPLARDRPSADDPCRHAGAGISL